MNLHLRPLFPITISYVAGVILATEAGLSPAAGLWIGAAALLAASAVRLRSLPGSVAVVAAGVFLAALVRTSAVRAVPGDDIGRFAEGKMVRLSGVIASDPEPRDDGRIRFVLRAETVKTYTGEYRVSGRAMVSVYRPRWGNVDPVSRYVPFHSDRVRIHGRLRAPGPSANPDAGSYRDYLARRRIFCTISADESAVRRLGPGPSSLSRATAWFKAALASKVRRLFPGERGGLLLGILLGNYAALSLGAQSAFMRTGTMHLLAASGYNCGVLVIIFLWILQRLTVPRAWTHVLLIALLWGFAALTGAGPSIIRATIMVTVLLSAYLLRRAPDLVNTVMLSALIILLANPLSLYDVGFQLSFAAVLAIVFAMPIMESCLRPERAKPRKQPAWRYRLPWRVAAWSARNVVGAVLLSVAAAVGTVPITAYYFNYLSIISVVANASVALLVVALTVFGLAAIAFSWVPLLGPAAAACGGSVSGLMLSAVEWFGGFPWASCSLRSPTWVLIVCYYVVVFAFFERAHRSNPPRGKPSDEPKDASE